MAERGHADEDRASPWSEYRRLVLAELQRLNDKLVEVEKAGDAYGAHLAALEDRTTGQRARIAALETSMVNANQVLGRIENRQADRQERVTELERQAAQKPTPAAAAWSDIPLKVLVDISLKVVIGAVVIGMALGSAGFDPATFFKLQ